MGAGLGTETEIPQILAERRRIFVEKTGELDLEGLDVGVSGPLDETKAKLNDHIIFAAQDFRDFPRYPFLHDLQVDLGHVNLLAELWRKLGALEELRIHSGRHDGQIAVYALSTAKWSGDERRSRDVGDTILL